MPIITVSLLKHDEKHRDENVLRRKGAGAWSEKSRASITFSENQVQLPSDGSQPPVTQHWGT